MWQGKACILGKTNFIRNLEIHRDDSRQSSPCVHSLPLRNTEGSSKRMLSSSTSLSVLFLETILSIFCLWWWQGRVHGQFWLWVAAVPGVVFPGVVFPFQRGISVRQEVLGGAFLCYVDTLIALTGVFSSRNFVWLKGFLQTRNIFSSCLPALLARAQRLIARKITAVRVPFRKPLDWLWLGCGFLEKHVSAGAACVWQSWLVTLSRQLRPAAPVK